MRTLRQEAATRDFIEFWSGQIGSPRWSGRSWPTPVRFRVRPGGSAARSPAAAEVDVVGHDNIRPGNPDCDWQDPAAGDRLLSALVSDAIAILEALGSVELDEADPEAVGLLDLVAGQDAEPGEEEAAGGSPAAPARIGGLDPRCGRAVARDHRRVRFGGIARNRLCLATAPPQSAFNASWRSD